MALSAHPTLLDNGPAILAARAATVGRIVQHIINGYTVGQSYATVTGNSVMNTAMVAGDFVLSNGASSSRTLTVGAKNSVTATGNATSGDLHTALVDTVSSEVLAVSDESSNINIASGNNYNIGSWTMNFAQPTQV
jgi:hypothetical protein